MEFSHSFCVFLSFCDAYISLKKNQKQTFYFYSLCWPTESSSPTLCADKCLSASFFLSSGIRAPRKPGAEHCKSPLGFRSYKRNSLSLKPQHLIRTVLQSLNIPTCIKNPVSSEKTPLLPTLAPHPTTPRRGLAHLHVPLLE